MCAHNPSGATTMSERVGRFDPRHDAVVIVDWPARVRRDILHDAEVGAEAVSQHDEAARLYRPAQRQHLVSVSLLHVDAMLSHFAN